MENKRRVSLVLLNWKRPDGIQKIIKHFDTIDEVDEIIIWNNNADLHFTSSSKKTKTINCSVDFGLYTRFSAASLAKNDCILFHDDDIMAPVESFKALFTEWKNSPEVAHAIVGRNPKNNQYVPNNEYGPVEIVLTRYVLVSKAICTHALSKTPLFYDLPGVPVGNGEDIILSYAAIEYSGKINKAYNLLMENLYYEDEHAISIRYPEHMAHRSKIIQRCKKVFRIGKHLTAWASIYQFFVKVNIAYRKRTQKLKL